MSEKKANEGMCMEERILGYAPKYFQYFSGETKRNVLNRLKKQAEKSDGFITTLMLLKQFDDLNVETNLKDEWIPQPDEIPGFKLLQPEDIEFVTELELEEEFAKVGLLIHSNVDKRFGFNVETAEHDDYVDISLVLNPSFKDSKLQVIYYSEKEEHLMAVFDVHPIENDWLVARFQEQLEKEREEEMGEIFTFAISLPFTL